MPTLLNPSDQTITQYNVQTGGANNLLNNVAPSATSGVPVISQGAASQPIFGTALVAGGGTGSTSFNTYGPVVAAATSTGALTSVSPSATSGIPLISQGAAANPAFGTAVVAGGGTGNTSFSSVNSVVFTGATSTSALQAPATGAANTVLTSNGAGILPTWKPASSSGSIVLLSTQTANNAVSLIFLDTTYHSYLLKWYNVVPILDQKAICLQYTTDSGVTYVSVGYACGVEAWAYNSAGNTNQPQTTHAQISNNISTNPAGSGVGQCFLHGFNAAVPFGLAGQASSFNPLVSWQLVISGGGNGTTGANGIKIFMESGNISTGTFSFYGIAE